MDPDKSVQANPVTLAKPISVVIVDDHPVLVSFLTEVLEREGRYKVTGRTDRAAEAVELCKRLKPTLVMLDIGLVDSNNLDCLRELQRDCPRSRVLIFTGRLSQSLVVDMLLAGAGGILLKTARVRDLLEAVDRVASGGIHLCAEACDAVRRFVASTPPDPKALRPDLSRQELAVLQHLATGLSSRQIATKMGLSRNTIGAFRARLMKKTGLHSTANLVLYAARLGLVRVPGLRVATTNPQP
ncbi:MAG: response regulator transcription factor [Lacunisphaera sp.]